MAQIDITGSHSSYRTYDERPFSPQSYYRLKAVDMDGSHTFLPAVVVEVDNKTQQAYPNPSSGSITMEHGYNTVTSIQIFDVYGKLVFEKNKITENKFHFEINEVPGIYIIEINADGGEAFFKLIKQQ